MLPASIPSPSEAEWFIGPIPIRAYAFAIMLGILVAIWLGNKRWLARGGKPEVVIDVAFVAVLFGIVGARAYHVLTDWDKYFGEGRDPVDALKIWEGGLSIWGAIGFGVLGGWIVARYKGIPMPALADALAPGIILAQAIGRWGNYFNQELYGRPTDLPWALEIDAAHRPDEYLNEPTFHPTFLYESLWALVVFGILIWADRRFQMGHGRVFALYVALYTFGRTGIESLRIDTGGEVEGPAREILGMRINAWVAVVLFVGAVLYIVISARLRPGREAPETLVGRAAPAEEGAEVGDDSGEDEEKASAEPDDEDAEVGDDSGVDEEEPVTDEPVDETAGGETAEGETGDDAPAEVDQDAAADAGDDESEADDAEERSGADEPTAGR
jgi:prolipoprotein diacylglyceryl transferase